LALAGNQGQAPHYGFKRNVTVTTCGKVGTWSSAALETGSESSASL
jgi:hypothetical protein